jgi:hypothetical protein
MTQLAQHPSSERILTSGAPVTATNGAINFSPPYLGHNVHSTGYDIYMKRPEYG